MGCPRSSRVALDWSAHLTGMNAEQTAFAGLDPLLTVEELAEYLGVPIATICDWRVDGEGPTRNGTPLTTISIRRRLRSVLSDAGIQGVTPHAFRGLGVLSAVTIASRSR